MNLDWSRLKAVVLQSDDWGLCAWVPDEQAYRVLADTPAFRAAAGRVYGRSTLESADDVGRLAATLAGIRTRDGVPPVLQANTVVAAPDYARLVPPRFETGGEPGGERGALPVRGSEDPPTRWRRPGLIAAVDRAIEAGAWWPELHGLTHVPQRAWLEALRRGAADARRAHEQQSAVCEAVEASGEFDPSEPPGLRSHVLGDAVARFGARFGRAPSSLCPPDYRWDGRLESDAARLGMKIVQGKAEQHGHPFPRLRRLWHRYRWPDVGSRYHPPPRIAFEPRGQSRLDAPLGVDATHAAARAAWRRGQPAIVSSHRVNYAHLDPGWSETGCQGLRALLARLAGEGAVFLTDAETLDLVMRGWSVRPLGARGALVRRYGPGRERVRFAAPDGARAASARPIEGDAPARVAIESGQVVAELGVGTFELAWARA